MRHRSFQVAVLWGDDVLVDVARPASKAEIGKRGARTFFPFSDELPLGTPAPRIEPLPGGEVALLLPMRLPVQIARDGATKSAPDLFAAGEASPVEVPVRGVRYVLGLNERVIVDCGPVKLIGRYLRPEDAPRRTLSERLDIAFVTTAILTVLLLVFVLAMLRLSRLTGTSLDGELTRGVPGMTKLIVKDVPPPRLVGPSSGGGQTQLAAAGPRGRSGKGAPRHDIDPRKIGLPALFDLLGNDVVLSGGGLDGLKKAMDGIKGPGYASNDYGPGDGPGRGGPGIGPGDSIGVGPIGPGGRPGLEDVGIGGAPKPVTQIAAGVNISDGLAKDVVARIVRRHWNEIRYCYERELSHDPNLAGKVAVYFQIGPIGDVLRAEVRETTLANEAAEQCMLENVRRWRFPQPAGGGLVDVNYPFLFQTGR